jgi:hypothetical protein
MAPHHPARSSFRALIGAAMAFAALPAVAQTAGSKPPTAAQAADEVTLATTTGHDVGVSLLGYDYSEPGATSISIHGPRVGGEYAWTLSLNQKGHWFARADVRGSVGSVTYDGWCMPFLITPNRSSPNGYQLDLGDPSPCSESGDRDWYVETRGVVGKDLLAGDWAWSPYAGLGFRHLSNGTTGIPGFRTDDYLYVPLGITARTRIAGHHVLSLRFEYDQLVHGWQTTRDSALGSGDVPATPTAPAFTIDGSTDISFDQHQGRALRASANVQVTRRWALEPFYVYWNVGDSPVSYETVTFTVRGVPAREQWGAYEPHNVTHEFGVKLGFHF